MSTRDIKEIRPVFSLGVAVGQAVHGGIVHASEVSGVPAVAAAKVLWRRFETTRPRTGTAGA